MTTCDKCQGSGRIETIEEKLRLVMLPLYNIISVEKRVYGAILIHIYRHTDMNGGVDGDIITSREMDKFKELGYYTAAIGREYIYLKPL